VPVVRLRAADRDLLDGFATHMEAGDAQGAAADLRAKLAASDVAA